MTNYKVGDRVVWNKELYELRGMSVNGDYCSIQCKDTGILLTNMPIKDILKEVRK